MSHLKQDPFDQWIDELSADCSLRQAPAESKPALWQPLMEDLGPWMRQQGRTERRRLIAITVVAVLVVCPILLSCTPPPDTMAVNWSSLHQKSTVEQSLANILCHE